jgi:archaellum component FlaG (FlaF/FlaG flagellin family)
MQTGGDKPVAGQLAGVTSAVPLASNQSCIAVLVQCDQAASKNLYVGDANSQPLQLKPGQAITINCSNLNMVYVAGTGGSTTANFIYEQ